MRVASEEGAGSERRVGGGKLATARGLPLRWERLQVVRQSWCSHFYLEEIDFPQITYLKSEGTGIQTHAS